LASGGGQAVKIWDLATAKQVLTLKTSFNPVTAVVWSPDGTQLIAVGQSASAGMTAPALIFDATHGYQREGRTGPEIAPLR
jgi:WD40 repeat protein